MNRVMEVDLISKLESKIEFANQRLKEEKNYREIDRVKNNIVETECSHITSRKLKHNIQRYNLAIKALENVKSTYLTNEEIEQIREKHERNLH